jgi:hypothetical protein
MPMEPAGPISAQIPQEQEPLTAEFAKESRRVRKEIQIDPPLDFPIIVDTTSQSLSWYVLILSENPAHECPGGELRKLEFETSGDFH